MRFWQIRWSLVLLLFLCFNRPGLSLTIATPSTKLTPGAIFPTATKGTVCSHGYSARVRQVTDEIKRRICLAYGIKSGCPGPAYEIDHLVSLELGGSNDDRNLWPQPIDQAREKDKAENRLHKAICANQIGLREAQVKVKDPNEWH